MTLEQIHHFISSKEQVVLERPFGPQPAVYKHAGKMFVLIDEHKDPLSISLKCDPGLSQYLRDRYETVMPGYHLNKKHWNTILLTGQLDDQRVYDLIEHSYQLVRQVPETDSV